MFKKLAREAKFAGYLHLAERLTANAGLVNVAGSMLFCQHEIRCIIQLEIRSMKRIVSAP